jgi:catechol 2,3-dioxygenase-like lactoylglutathione lyase family enzyme
MLWARGTGIVFAGVQVRVATLVFGALPGTQATAIAAGHKCLTHTVLTMSDSNATEQVTQKWYARPVLFVSDLQVALRFYVGKLGFRKKWHEADGAGTVCQVDRGGCEIILCEDRERGDKGRLFVELNRDGLDELRREISERSVPAGKTWWGYDVIRIADPDGNELLFPLDEANDGEREPR